MTPKEKQDLDDCMQEFGKLMASQCNAGIDYDIVIEAALKAAVSFAQYCAVATTKK